VLVKMTRCAARDSPTKKTEVASSTSNWYAHH
jgi:hypothetical protein